MEVWLRFKKTEQISYFNLALKLIYTLTLVGSCS